MNYYIITGTSRGIGEALALQLLQESNVLFCLSRTDNPRLTRHAREKNAACTHIPFDLNHVHDVERLFTDIIQVIEQTAHTASITLINNAGMLSPVAPVERIGADLMVENLTVNLLAPMALTSAFIRYTETWPVLKRILNISSGSAKYLLPSQSCYSTAKAGLDSFSKSVNLEQTGKEHPVKIASVYPGMIDTRLQAEIREVSKEDFPYVDTFVQLAQEGKLQTPEYTAGKLIALLSSPDFGSQALIEEL